MKDIEKKQTESNLVLKRFSNKETLIDDIKCLANQTKKKMKRNEKQSCNKLSDPIETIYEMKKKNAAHNEFMLTVDYFVHDSQCVFFFVQTMTKRYATFGFSIIS